jgi:hypothetical protein
MRAFVVPAGTAGIAIKTRQEWTTANLRHITTRAERIFYLEQIVVDPTGISRHVPGPGHANVIGGHYAKAGYYGFETHDACTHENTPANRAMCAEGWILLTRDVTVH